MISYEMDATEFFVAGGTLRPDSPSYVERPADEEVFNLVMAGEFCYVLSARQMGKSSLMIRTARRLKARGVNPVIIDLTKIGIDVSVEQWYLGLLTQLKRKLRLSVDLETWWQKQAGLGYVQRFTDFMHDILLKEIEGQVAIFMDEIDTTLNLAFSDDFFAAIRFVYNARATDSAFERLTFVLLGVATPADLIKDRSRTPFNIGQGVDLSDFSREDARVLQEGLKTAYPQEGQAIFNRIYYWTHGHPYLTQKLCLSAAEVGAEPWTDAQVDKLVERQFLSKEARKETNLQFVRDNVRTSPQRRRLLNLYRRVYLGKTVRNDDRSPDHNQLKLFGLVRVENDVLRVRNEIYRQVFNLEWIKANTPVDWTRRITIILTILLVMVMAALAYTASRQGQQAEAERAQAFIENFRSTTSPDVRITSLAGLFDLPNYTDEASRLFYDELSPEERLALFEAANPETVGAQMTTVVKGLYTSLGNNERDNELLRAMARPLRSVNDNRAGNLANEIEQWLQGRALFNDDEFQSAIAVYDVVIEVMNDRNPGIYFDRGAAHAALGQAQAALQDFETALNLDNNRQREVVQAITADPDLYDAAVAGGASYPLVAAMIPSPTSTLTPTPTWTFTPTPSPTFTPAPPTPSPTPQETPAPAPVELPTNTPTPSPTPTVTPTPTPRPATVVYVQGSGQTHTLGLVSSGGRLINGSLHRFASAPAWSPRGEVLAFYGEPGINQLGGVYGQGSGIWLMDMPSGAVNQLYQTDHIITMNWSPDGDRLAFEFGPPGVTHEVIIIDAGTAQELSRFAGEQPAWTANSDALAIKSCRPECGLWQVGVDGGGARLLTSDSTDSYPAWSADGRYLAYSSRLNDGDWEIYRLNLAAGDLLRLTNRLGTDTTPVFSPDSREVYLRTDAFGDWQIRAMAVDGGNERVVQAGVGPSDDWGLARPAVR